MNKLIALLSVFCVPLVLCCAQRADVRVDFGGPHADPARVVGSEFQYEVEANSSTFLKLAAERN